MATAQAVAKEKEVRLVHMQDGRKVEFPGKRRLQKSSNLETGVVTFDFEDGSVRTWDVFNSPHFKKFALHGAEQKGGDEIAGIKNEDGSPADIEDLVLAFDELSDRLDAGDWGIRREGSGVAGTSILVRALMIHFEEIGKAKTVQWVRDWLKTKSPTDKTALRKRSKITPIVDRLEAEKAAKASAVDTDALLEEGASA